MYGSAAAEEEVSGGRREFVTPLSRSAHVTTARPSKEGRAVFHEYRIGVAIFAVANLHETKQMVKRTPSERAKKSRPEPGKRYAV
ncbi:hypothetical protein BN2476_320292 [Paraburkholderia piptadeniae]|uniref:Uncharacterized protein n=1 Tax=Paraburkholderia piptadeniae TaxID=1701573 RepID=A0A1N7S5Z6_9BURK|nr:hypothetical protein BN2476_320292 [Paraburkholderia piptadeniae]